MIIIGNKHAKGELLGFVNFGWVRFTYVVRITNQGYDPSRGFDPPGYPIEKFFIQIINRETYYTT